MAFDLGRDILSPLSRLGPATSFEIDSREQALIALQMILKPLLVDHEDRKVAVQALGSLTVLQLIVIPVTFLAVHWLAGLTGVPPQEGSRGAVFVTGVAGVAIPLTLVHLFIAFCRFLILLSSWALCLSGAILFLTANQVMWGVVGASLATSVMTWVIRDIKNKDEALR